MRTLEGHKVNPANDVITVTVVDDPGHGGACHEYTLSGPNFSTLHLRFQNGPIAEAGVNGITHEALLSILIDRMEGFQRGAFANDHNASALTHMRGAQTALQNRTRERMSRNVEGTHTV